ncbi:SDR family NAD(P)-dependent oxidoreductase [Streptantibioticus ferralitis]|uniref:SDR family NAD(P)-dependent oxidoreductase n=1 Tax=Streptantibioticus ferralitis TaxID=236510 RepID=A0ABT5YWY2_9ACTN|nr:SDR family oxidoreductase [Streptantibioticus ferralitis]MDF2255993.1 SDR family NAD(P)-dependent oxidoreductase [Streptantibioticus ferralitis]
MTSTELAGATALVTGATSGIGRAAAVSLARRGAQVIVSGRDEARGDDVVASIRSLGGKADFIASDLGDADAVRALARQAIDIGGGHLDILVNNAGVYPAGPTCATTADDIDRAYAVNVRAPFLLVAELAPAMAARGQGAIVNVVTMVAHFGVAGMALYGSSKAALTLLTKAWAAEFGPSGVRVNAVSPGPTRTEGTRRFGDQVDQLASLAPAGRPAAPEEIAAAITYLVSEDATFVHGAILDVDGGRNAA